MEKLYMLFIALLLLSSCSDYGSLPDSYTVQAVKDAFLEQVNYRHVLDVNFDIPNLVYDGQEIELEVRVYDQTRVCATTSLDDRLAWFELRGDIVVCTGFSRPGENMWPKLGDYEVAWRGKVTIEAERRPNFGQSELKDKLIDILTEFLYWRNSDWLDGDRLREEYANATICICDYYLYDWDTYTADTSGPYLGVVTCFADGTIMDIGCFFERTEVGIPVCPAKPAIFQSLSELTQEGQIWIEG